MGVIFKGNVEEGVSLLSLEERRQEPFSRGFPSQQDGTRSRKGQWSLTTPGSDLGVGKSPPQPRRGS